jgi:hypothetical protein
MPDTSSDPYQVETALGQQSNELPARLLALIDELVKVEPPVVPSEARPDLNA